MTPFETDVAILGLVWLLICVISAADFLQLWWTRHKTRRRLRFLSQKRGGL